MSATYILKYNSLRNVTPPEEENSGRRRYCGNASAQVFFELPDDLNIREYLQTEVNGKPIKKKTQVNDAIRNQLDENRVLFPILSGGITLIANEAEVDDKDRKVKLLEPSIINGSQSRGVLKDYFEQHTEDKEYPSVNFEIIVCSDKRLAAEITIARNFQNAVLPVSTYGARGVFDDLERAISGRNGTVKLTKSETDVGPEYIDTEKLIQVVTAMLPASVSMPRASKSKGNSEGIRVYAYAQKATCLKDFAEIVSQAASFSDAKAFYEDVSYDAWNLYRKLRGYQGFSSIQAVTKNKNGKVVEDGVPAGIVFPVLSALGKFATQQADGRWKLDIPADFDLDDLCKQAKATYLRPGPGQSNPQTMGKELACYLNLHALVDAYIKYRRP
jgi:hypothetical protein